MEEPVETKSDVKKVSFWPFIAWPAAVLVIYFLSVGPFVLLLQKGIIRGKAKSFLTDVYFVPIDVVCNVPIIEKGLSRYIEFWLQFDEEG